MTTLGRACVGLVAVSMALGVPRILLELAGRKPARAAEAQLASPARLAALYQAWSVAHEAAGGGRRLEVSLGWPRGTLVEGRSAHGSLTLDLLAGAAQAEVQGLPGLEWDLWLVDNQPGEGRSARPEPGDLMRRVGRFQRTDDSARLTLAADAGPFDAFDVDVAAVTRSGMTPDQALALSGSPSLFQRLYARTRRKAAARADARQAFGFDALLGVPAVYAASPLGGLSGLIDEGSRLFFDEPFAGNGRTCGSCHPAENNFTIDPAFIATRRPDDALFVAETNPDLAANFEKPELMRRLGLVLENVDGFDDLANKFVMRGVPHLLGLSRYLVPGNQPVPPLQRTGWGGDGAPGSGTLREFPTGAVIQHFTKTLARVPGVDFRLPTDDELDALEAFTLSIGRQDNPVIDAIRFRDPVVAFGREAFQGRGVASFCFVCHANAGANTGGGTNNNFDIGVGRLPNHPADLIRPGNLPKDGGFGREPVFDPETGEFLGFGLAGEVNFNSQPAIESVDTPPFFHNNAVQTIEEAVGFYNSQAFKDSAAGALFPIRMETTDVEAIAAMLRVLNAVENIRSARELVEVALAESDAATARRLAELAGFDSQDGAEVLLERRLHLPAAAQLRQAALKQRAASRAASSRERNLLLEVSLRLLAAAKAEMIAG